MENDFYVGVLPKGLTKEMVEKVQDFRNEIVSPYVQVVSERAHDIMKENNDIDVVAANAFYGHEELSVQIHRKSKFVNEEGEAIDMYGHVITANKIDMGKHQIDYDDTIAAIGEVFADSFMVVEED